MHRSIARPVVAYLCQLEEQATYHRLVVLIPDMQPEMFRYYRLLSQRGVILDRASRRGPATVVRCRLRYRFEPVAAGDAAAAPPPRRPG